MGRLNRRLAGNRSLFFTTSFAENTIQPRPVRCLFCKAPVRQPNSDFTRVCRVLQTSPRAPAVERRVRSIRNRVDHASCPPLPLPNTNTYIRPMQAYRTKRTLHDAAAVVHKRELFFQLVVRAHQPKSSPTTPLAPSASALHVVRGRSHPCLALTRGRSLFLASRGY